MPTPFRHRLRVRFQECDPQGVVYFARYLDYVDIALTELWRERFGSYRDMMDTGTDMVVAEANLRYRAAALFDDEVEVELSLERLGNTSMTTLGRIARDGETLVEASIRQVFITTNTREKKPIPDALRAALEDLVVDRSHADADT